MGNLPDNEIPRLVFYRNLPHQSVCDAMYKELSCSQSHFTTTWLINYEGNIYVMYIYTYIEIITFNNYFTFYCNNFMYYNDV